MATVRTRLAVLVTHPVQYFSPWFRELARNPEIECCVYYCYEPDARSQGGDFGVAFKWDVPLLDGYPSRFLRNVSKRPGWRFFGCDTPEIHDIIKSRAHDVWLICGWAVKSYWQAIRACWKYRVPMLVRGDSNLLGRRSLPVRLVKRLILGTWIPRFQGCLTVGELNRKFYEHYGAPSTRIFPVRHFVENDFFAEGSAKCRERRNQLRDEWDIPQEAVCFVFAGKFIDKKRPLDVLRAMALLQNTRANIWALMVGDGALRTDCERFAREHRVKASFTGFLNQSQIVSAYAAADVLVLPSAYDETWGLVVNEANACGLPAVVSNMVGCAPDLVRPDCGFVFHAGDVNDLAQRMGEYAATPALASQHGRNARQNVQGYSVGTATNALLDAINAITRNRRKSEYREQPSRNDNDRRQHS